ncbi:hypothetical protein VE03_10038 [Pseudogymnoascus sp. 23342-1-I1]|nr:hypothetical protein VE03_10038 [Pseudogymnoascus sp. 23342-1-I1]
MRLINAKTLELEEIWGENDKAYAILSHRWEGGEVSFQDMQNLALASNMKGFGKIQKSCEQAVEDGYSYVWVDTCCIDKDSSAELSEALNSMFRWYEASAVCYAFLSDVPSNTPTMTPDIGSSKWFTRGWTLQELVATRNVVFYNQQWEFLGTKQTLSKLLSLQTHIDEAILNGESLSNRTIAQRMSWASHRVTTRVEDTAYCLLGIFDVYMPMLYGEGKRAFLRLQEEIIKRSDDHTIFAWPIRLDDQPGLLADSPAAFADFASDEKNVYKDRINGFRIISKFLKPPKNGKDRFIVSAYSWDPEERIVAMKPGDFGTTGFLDFGRQVRNCNCIKIGFDFDHNPVCFIANGGDGFDGIGHPPRSTDISQWTEDERTQHLAEIHQRTSFDKFAWSKVTNS